MEDLFDDEFDPRADERKKTAVGEKKEKDKFGLDPFGDDFMNDVLVCLFAHFFFIFAQLSTQCCYV